METNLETHSFTLTLPTRTTFEDVESIAERQIVFPHMSREGKSGYADLHVQTRLSTNEPGFSKFSGSYKL
ncbi:hypothetical protein A3852_13010 [Rhodococcus qingshengii]|nr:hypothetical protein A3852_13010 [Rhodococcus qingshengii]